MRRNLRRVAAVAFASMLTIPTALHAEQCPIKAREAFEAAREQGMTFRVRTGDTERCRIDGPTLVASASQEAPAECEFLLLGGRQLASGWTLSSLTLLGDALVSGKPLEGRAGWIVRIRAAKAMTRQVVVRRVVLKGPRCDDYRQAFQ